MISCFCPEAAEEFAEFVFHEYRELPNNSVKTVFAGPFLMVRVLDFVAVVSSLCSVAGDDDISAGGVEDDDLTVSSSAWEYGDDEVTVSESVPSDSSQKYDLLESNTKKIQHRRRDRIEELIIVNSYGRMVILQ